MGYEIIKLHIRCLSGSYACVKKMKLDENDDSLTFVRISQ